LNHAREACVAHDPSERLGPDLPFADPLVAVAARAERALGVVEVQTLEQGETNHVVELLPHLVDRAGHIIPRGVEMGRVEAEPDPRPDGGRQRVAQRPQPLERRPQPPRGRYGTALRRRRPARAPATGWAFW